MNNDRTNPLDNLEAAGYFTIAGVDLLSSALGLRGAVIRLKQGRYGMALWCLVMSALCFVFFRQHLERGSQTLLGITEDDLVLAEVANDQDDSPEEILFSGR